MNWLLSPLGLKIGLSLLLLSGVAWWHTAAIRNAKQQQAADTQTEVLIKNNAEHEIEKQKYEERITDLENKMVILATKRAESTQRIEVITRDAENQRNEVDSKSDPDVLLAIRERLQPRTHP